LERLAEIFSAQVHARFDAFEREVESSLARAVRGPAGGVDLAQLFTLENDEDDLAARVAAVRAGLEKREARVGQRMEALDARFRRLSAPYHAVLGADGLRQIAQDVGVHRSEITRLRGEMARVRGLV